ncbi:glycerate kinase family protein [Fibrella aquatilis]|uniref:Glycerate kinase n=1 Tax=Fibrella aquatilis TaxID=2817059 RepID=A0A939G167_9BACT|nr:glycerate kinase [Fibrella aquatilis]MBO0929971.1 glycerate kinase [Fibrella aquatilis]
MPILLAPDKFRGSLSAAEACAAMEAGIRLVLPDAQVTALPMADGGEGTAELLTQVTKGIWHTAFVNNPLFKLIEAGFGLSTDGQTAFIDSAAAAGLALLAAPERDTTLATTYGLGQLIEQAIAGGAKTVVLGLGGSATTDGGTGLAAALGWQFLNAAGQTFTPTGGTLIEIAQIIPPASPLPVRLRVACDVQNPLYGPTGAAMLFAPQKGATPVQVSQLDKGLRHLDQLMQQQLGMTHAAIPGAGAAGGLGYGLITFLGATLEPGVDVVLDAVAFDEHLSGASLVLTGEGKLDGQTAQGKLIAGICRRAGKSGVPVVALCGTLTLAPEEIQDLGLLGAFSVLNRPQQLAEAVLTAADDLRATTFNVMRLLRTYASLRL